MLIIGLHPRIQVPYFFAPADYPFLKKQKDHTPPKTFLPFYYFYFYRLALPLHFLRKTFLGVKITLKYFSQF
jgi:hypothetical protein